jgi:pimeloyl-ACP methyl ester carboxylesterase
MAERISSKFSTVVCAADLRHHGLSEDALPTFGMAESWDIQATLDEADKYNSPKPYILIGESLGAMAAQVAAIRDPRVAGAFLIHPPGWPCDAVGKRTTDCIRRNLPVTCWIDYLSLSALWLLTTFRYGRDMLGEGDIRRMNGHPAHKPRVLYIMGTRDYFDMWQTKAIYDHWYNGIPATWNLWPSDARNERKWFISVDNAEHPVANYTVFNWEHFGTVLDQFLELCL